MFKKALLAVILLASFAGCHNSLDVLAPYKESVAVYGLLCQDSAEQYIRVQRVYLGEGNALVMAQNPDSCWFKPGELKVSLQRIKNGLPVSVDNPASAAMEIVLTEQYLQTDSGIFNRDQLIYKTTHPIYDDSQYQLLIHNNRTGKDFSSQTPVSLVGDFASKLVYGQQGSQLTLSYAFINIVPSYYGTVICKFGSPTNSGVCGLKVRYYYTEYPGATAANGVPKYLDYNCGIQYPLHTVGGGDEIDLSYVGDDLLQEMARIIAIGDDPVAVNHRVSDSVHFYLNAGGTDLGLYNQVNGTTTLSQDKPYFTNIKGGVGIFSSRREYFIRKRLSGQCLDHIASAHITCPLRFWGQGNTIIPCQ